MKNKYLLIPVVIIILILVFLGISFVNYSNLMNSVYFPEEMYGAQNTISNIAYQAEVGESVEFVVELYPNQTIKDTMFANYPAMDWIDEVLPVYEYLNIVEKNTKVNLSLTGYVETYSGGKYFTAPDLENFAYYKVTIFCSEEVDFVKELELKQKNCTADIEKSNEDMYMQGESEIKTILEDATPVEVIEIFEKIHILENNFEGSFIEYLSNPSAFENKIAQLNQENSILLSDLVEAFQGPKVNPQNELDEIINYMSDKNMDFVVLSRQFELDNELIISSDYDINFNDSLLKYEKNRLILSKGENYILKNNMTTPWHLGFIIKKENNNFTIKIRRV